MHIFLKKNFTLHDFLFFSFLFFSLLFFLFSLFFFHGLNTLHSVGETSCRWLLVVNESAIIIHDKMELMQSSAGSVLLACFGTRCCGFPFPFSESSRRVFHWC